MQIGGQLRSEAPVNGGRNYKLTAVVPRTKSGYLLGSPVDLLILAARSYKAEEGGSEKS